MTYQPPYTDKQKDAFVKRIMAGDSIRQINRETSISRDQLMKWRDAYMTKHGVRNPSHGLPLDEREKINIFTKTKAKILLYDTEVLPNKGYFYDRYSDYGIPHAFIRTPKAFCAIGYKWLGDENVTVLSTKKPYDDKGICKEFASVWEEADYVVAHNGDGFDIPILNARYYYHKLDPLPPVASVDTLKMARQRWRQQLNGNSLDHIAEMAGLGRKLKIDASLWVRCCEGDKDAMKEMIEYNEQDVNLLELLFADLLPHSKNKVNQNLHIDSPVKVCDNCGSDDLIHKGFEFTANSYKHRYKCNACKSYSTVPKGSKKECTH